MGGLPGGGQRVHGSDTALKSGSKLAKMDTQNQLEIDAAFPSLFGSILEPKIRQNFQNAILEMWISLETSFKK